MKLSEQLKQQRTQRHWSQQDLADHLKISRQSISKWERGTALPSFANVVAISDLFQLSLDELIRDDDAMMAEFTETEDIGPVGRIIYGGLFWGVLGAVIVYFLGMGYENTEELIALPVVLVFIALISVIYANQKHHRAPLSRVVFWLSIGLIALMVLPIIEMNIETAVRVIPGAARAGWQAGAH